MHCQLLSCEVFYSQVEAIKKDLPPIPTVYTEQKTHEHPDRLRSILQNHIDNNPVDVTLLLYGLCGNATLGLVASQSTLVIPRAHDCCTLFLGSKKRFQTLFQDNPSEPFETLGYASYDKTKPREAVGLSKEQEDYVRLMVRVATPSRISYIAIPHRTSSLDIKKERTKILSQGSALRLLLGEERLLFNLLTKTWDEEDFLVVPRGYRIRALYDWEIIMDKEPLP